LLISPSFTRVYAAFAALPAMLPTLYPLVATGGDVRQQFEACSRRATELLGTYTDIMMMLSKKCLYWDQTLVAAERLASSLD
jgi:hypothetical protein